MSDTTADDQVQKEDYFAVVASVLSKSRIAINRGMRDEIKKGQRFLLYELSDEEIEDTVTGRSLGRLEIPKGTGKVSHVQDQMAIIESDRRTETKRQLPVGIGGMATHRWLEELEEDRPISFQSPKVGDPVKLI